MAGTVRLWSVPVLVVLLSMDPTHSNEVSEGLSCVNDLINNVTCTWKGASLENGLDCWITGSMKIPKPKRQSTQKCLLTQHGRSLPGCSFVFEGSINCVKKIEYICMECSGSLVQNLTKFDPCYHIKMRPPSAPNVSRPANETLLTWSEGSPGVFFLTTFDFEIQIRQNHQPWEEAKVFTTQEQQLSIPAGKFQGHCQARVRIKPFGNPNHYKSHWSDWSPTTYWLEPTDKETTSQDEEGPLMLARWIVVGCVLLFLVVIPVVWCCLRRGLNEDKFVPNPSDYFNTLYSVHEGNLKKWINPVPTLESFFTVQPSEHISPVQLCESWDEDPSTLALLHLKSSHLAHSDIGGVVDDSSASSSACFSNMGYFMSDSSGGSASTNPSSAYFTFHDDFRNPRMSSSLHLSICPSINAFRVYESLKREPHSPDSGFQDEGGFGGDGRLEDVKGEDVPFLILPLHLPSHLCAPSSPPPSPCVLSVSQGSADSLQLDEPVEEDAGGSYAAWPSAGAMCRSSSMHVETFKSGYLTLKELQATFSNKSI